MCARFDGFGCARAGHEAANSPHAATALFARISLPRARAARENMFLCRLGFEFVCLSGGRSSGGGDSAVAGGAAEDGAAGRRGSSGAAAFEVTDRCLILGWGENRQHPKAVPGSPPP